MYSCRLCRRERRVKPSSTWPRRIFFFPRKSCSSFRSYPSAAFHSSTERAGTTTFFRGPIFHARLCGDTRDLQRGLKCDTPGQTTQKFFFVFSSHESLRGIFSEHCARDDAHGKPPMRSNFLRDRRDVFAPDAFSHAPYGARNFSAALSRLYFSRNKIKDGP